YRGLRVRADLQAGSAGHPHQPRQHPQGSSGHRLQDRAREVQGGVRRRRGALEEGAASARRHGQHRQERGALRPFEKRGVSHDVLNAKQHEREAEIVAQAGRKGRITISTNMAGRGTDILLGGNPEFLARREVGPEPAAQEIEGRLVQERVAKAKESGETRFAPVTAAEVDAELSRLHGEWKVRFDAAIGKYREECVREHEQVISAGGLHILGTERHESRRIDNQLRGRGGRQGDPGSSKFYLSLEDDLMRIFASDRISKLMATFGVQENEPIEHPWLSKAIEGAQKRVEGQNSDIGKNLLEYDDVMNQQRKTIYGMRKEVLA